MSKLIDKHEQVLALVTAALNIKMDQVLNESSIICETEGLEPDEISDREETDDYLKKVAPLMKEALAIIMGSPDHKIAVYEKIVDDAFDDGGAEKDEPEQGEMLKKAIRPPMKF